MKNKRNIFETPQPVEPSIYDNIDFRNIGHGNPISDKINPSLLSDIETAAKKANIDVTITTAVSGHQSGTRHEKGLAVDIAMINNKGWSSYQDANQKGIYGGMRSFVENLKNMGYLENKEWGNDKSVLWFGFDGHNNHIHVSKLSDESGEQTTDKVDKQDKSIDDEDNTELTTTTTTFRELSLGFLDPFLKGLEGVGKEARKKLQKEDIIENKSLMEEIKRIKNLLK